MQQKKKVYQLKDKKYQDLATEYGFNNLDEYKCEIGDLDGDTIIQAQKLVAIVIKRIKIEIMKVNNQVLQDYEGKTFKTIIKFFSS